MIGLGLGCVSMGSGGTSSSGIAYDRPVLTGQTISYRTGDDAWNLANGTYDYTPPTYPASYAQLNTFTTLLSNNAFGNTNRFTDDVGTQIYANAYVIDHLTGLGWSKNLQGSGSKTWNNCIDEPIASSFNSFTDWRCPNFSEYTTLMQTTSALTGGSMNYAPFNHNVSTRKASSTTRPNATTTTFVFQTDAWGTNTKTNSNKYYLLVRNHYT